MLRFVTADKYVAMNRAAPCKKHPKISFYFLILPLLLFSMTAGLCSCGYSNPYVKKSPQGAIAKTLFTTAWQNRTNELGLESKYLRLLTSWFKKSGRINIVFDEDIADLKLTGEITSIDLPGLFYDSFDEALEIEIKITMNFSLYDNRSNTILWQEKNHIVYESFLLDPKGGQTEYNKNRALLHIGDEIAELIYLRTHEIVSDMP